jgi:ABC-type lipoprotein export system ATPase subunit
MVGEPCVILADEPTGDLDSATSNSIIALMVELKERLGVTFIVATHNPLLVQASTHSYELVDGRLTALSHG